MASHSAPPPHPEIQTPSLIPISASFHHLTTSELSALSSLSAAAKASAYCPYSKFRVGCTVLTSSGEFISGANVENASYNVGTCAERACLARAIISAAEKGEGHTEQFRGGVRKDMFKALAISTDVSPPASPCGMCRQLYALHPLQYISSHIGAYSIPHPSTPCQPSAIFLLALYYWDKAQG